MRAGRADLRVKAVLPVVSLALSREGCGEAGLEAGCGADKIARAVVNLVQPRGVELCSVARKIELWAVILHPGN